MSPVSRTYDTGLDKPQRAFLRDSIVEALAPLTKAEDAYIAAVIPYWRRVQSKQDVGLLLAELEGKDPAIAVVIGRATYSGLGVDGRKDQYSKEAQVFVYFMSCNLRGPGAALTGDVRSELDDTKDPGVEVMMEQADQLLVGFQPPDDGRGTIYKLVPKEEDEVDTDSDFTIWEKTFGVRLDCRIDRRRAITQAHTLLHSEISEERVPEDANPLVIHESEVNEDP